MEDKDKLIHELTKEDLSEAIGDGILDGSIRVIYYTVICMIVAVVLIVLFELLSLLLRGGV